MKPNKEHNEKLLDVNIVLLVSNISVANIKQVRPFSLILHKKPNWIGQYGCSNEQNPAQIRVLSGETDVSPLGPAATTGLL
jgi:hypothetical protein